MFGNYETWVNGFKATGAMRGIGWAVLYYDKQADKLYNVWINEHDTGHFAGCVPILIMDVFEHAFMIDYGTKIVCGVTPGKSGQDVDGIPVYSTIKEALQKHPEINASVIFVPPRFAKSAMLEAIENKIPLITVITENIPLHDTAYCLTKAKENKVYFTILIFFLAMNSFLYLFSDSVLGFLRRVVP